MKQKAPWADLTTPVYIAFETKQHKSWVIFYAWFCVAVLVFCAFVTRYHLVCGILSVLLAFAIVTKRILAVSERGLDTFTDLQIFSSNENWSWDEIEYLTYENNPDVPDMTLLFFTKGARTRRAFFKNKDAEQIKTMARVRKITVYDGNEYRAEARRYNAEQDKYRKPKRKKK